MVDLVRGLSQPDRGEAGESLAAALDGAVAGGHRRLDRLRPLRRPARRWRRRPPGPRCPRAPRRRRPRCTARRRPRRACATPSAVLPNAVWASIRPSPVMTRSASASRASKSVASMTSSTPGRRANERNRSGDREEGEADAAGGAGAGRVADSPAGRCASSASAQRGEPASSSTTSAARRALLRAVDGRRARSARAADWRRRTPRPGRRPRAGVEAARGRRAARRGRHRRPDRAAGPRRHRSWRCRRCRGRSSRRRPRSPPGSASPVPTRVAATASRSAGRDARQAGRLGHLDDGAVAVVGSEPARLDRPPERVVDLGGLPVPAAGGGDRLERALAAVGERAEERRVVRAGPEPAVGQRPRDLDGRQRALERVGREEDGPRRGPPEWSQLTEAGRLAMPSGSERCCASRAPIAASDGVGIEPAASAGPVATASARSTRAASAGRAPCRSRRVDGRAFRSG